MWQRASSPRLALAMAGLCGLAPTLGGCQGASGSRARSSATAAEQAQQIFELRCTPCHGPRGEGDGPATASLTPRPRNFRSADWQKSVTDEYIEKIVMYGGPAVGKSPMMPANRDLIGKHEVVESMRAYVRKLGHSN